MNVVWPLEHLPHRLSSAVDNMALDSLMLESWPRAGVVRFRAYGWSEVACTFGRMQPLAWVQAQPEAQGATLVRRVTGGGLVDHRNDWTWSLVLPREHPAASAPPLELYALLHENLQRALVNLGVETDRADQAPTAPLESACFAAPTTFDLADSGQKRAGAALRRTRDGVLVQGSVRRDGMPTAVWESLAAAFVGELRIALSAAKATSISWDDLSSDAFQTHRESFAADRWLRYR